MEFTPSVEKVGKKLFTITPIFDKSNKELQPDVLGDEFCESITNCENFWPNEPRMINRIASDYGRSHYIFTNSSCSIGEAVHKYIFCSLGEVDADERKDFFTKLNIWHEKMPAFCADFTAERGRILTRTKYELVINYIRDNSNFTLPESRKIALYALYLSCQDFLAWIKRCALSAIEKHYPKLCVNFIYFQSNVVCVNNKATLSVKLLNHLPKSGAWQCKGQTPTDNKLNVGASFVIDLTKVHEDYGTVEVSVGDKHKHYKRSMSTQKKGKRFGLYISEGERVIKYCDTLPTW